MHCDCCDQILTEAEQSARFIESGEFVNMCTECRSTLPEDIRWRTRKDLERKEREGEDADSDYNSNPFDPSEYFDDED